MERCPLGMSRTFRPMSKNHHRHSIICSPLSGRSLSLTVRHSAAESDQLLEADSSKKIPTSAAPLWLPADPSCEQDVTRVLRRLFASPSDIAGVEEDQQSHESIPRADNGRVSADEGRGVGEENTVAGTSGAQSGCDLPPPAAKVAFPALIARYCCKGGKGWEGQGLSWLDSDQATCTALELDVHALAMLVFVEWREFVSALPGCGAVLSKETSALWFAQVMSGYFLKVCWSL